MKELSIIKKIREEKRLSKVALAKLSGVSRTKIKGMEANNKGNFKDVVLVMRALGFELRAQLISEQA